MKHSALTMMAFLTCGLLATPVFAQNRESILAALTKLAPAEREARIVEGAKKENGLVWYSSTTAEDALALIKKFHEHYANIHINHFRSSSEKLLERILAESRAHAFKADIVSLPELELSIMIKRKLLIRYEPLENAIYPPESKDPRGYWTDFTPRPGYPRIIPIRSARMLRRKATRISSMRNGRAALQWITSPTIGTWCRCVIWRAGTEEKRRWTS